MVISSMKNVAMPSSLSHYHALCHIDLAVMHRSIARKPTSILVCTYIHTWRGSSHALKVGADFEPVEAIHAQLSETLESLRTKKRIIYSSTEQSRVRVSLEKKHCRHFDN